MNENAFRLIAGIGACLAVAAYFQTWVTVSMPPGSYSPLAGSGLEVAPYKMTVGIVAIGVALVALASNIATAVLDPDASLLNRGITVVCGVVTLCFVGYLFYSPMGFAEQYSIVRLEVEDAPPGILVDIYARKNLVPIAMAAAGGLAVVFAPITAALTSES